MIKEEHFKEIAALIPNATLDKVPGCTHMNIIRNDAAREIMRRWLVTN